MANQVKIDFLNELSKRYGSNQKLAKSLSLYEIDSGPVRVYIRYSKIHSKNQTFYGLRQKDLQRLVGHPAVICFLWENQKEPLLLPFSEFEDIFQSISPASDGQYKVQIYLKEDGNELHIAGAGRYNVEAYFGWDELESLLDDSSGSNVIPDLTHPQVQTLLGSIGASKGYDVWIPVTDRKKLDWSLADHFDCRPNLPYGFEQVINILQEVDVIWLERGSSKLTALFEVEHSTPIYSGLLRFNDIHLVAPSLHPKFGIVANNARRSLFMRQINRPTFQTSGLHELCGFFEYRNVFKWHKRTKL